MKIAIFYDSLVSKGGGERHIIQLANILNADIITSGYDSKLNDWMPIKGKVIDIGNVLISKINPLGFLIESPIRFFLNRNNFDYDANIYCGFSSIFCSTKKNKSKNIYYSLSPNRILYDSKETIIKNTKWYAKPFFILYRLFFYKLDQKIILNNFKKIVSQSQTVKDRVIKYYNKDSKIIFPPIEVTKFRFKKFGDFFLIVSRLYPEKRMSLVAKAFTKLPNKKLVIVGDGPEKNKVLQIINNYKNIKLLVNVNDKELQNLYSNCFALLYMPVNEDFGLVPLEGMASGKICIAANEGGCKETIVDGKTGFLITASEKNIINTINKLNFNKVEKMKNDCINQANKFNIDNYAKKWKNELKELIKQIK